MRNISTVFILAAISSIPAAALTIVAVGGNPDSSTVLGGNFHEILLTSWTSAVAYSNVSVSAVVGASSTSISAYLATQIGSTATSATLIASTIIDPSSGQETDTLFSGLSLPASVYYLILTSTTTSMAVTQDWWETNSPAVTTGTGVTRGFEGAAFTGFGSPNGSYPPGSTFGAVTDNFLFSVTGTPVGSAPEPSSFLLLVSSGTLIGLSFRLRRKDSAKNRQR